jgi:tetratricopeptide (TPR) repeat protein
LAESKNIVKIKKSLMKSNRLNQLMSFLEASPEDSFILFAIAKEYEKYDDMDNAMKYYLELKQKDPRYVGLYYHLGKLLEKQTHYQAAFDTYAEGIKVAKEVGDNHAMGELAQAKMIVEEDFLEG